MGIKVNDPQTISNPPAQRGSQRDGHRMIAAKEQSQLMVQSLGSRVLNRREVSVPTQVDRHVTVVADTQAGKSPALFRCWRDVRCCISDHSRCERRAFAVATGAIKRDTENAYLCGRLIRTQTTPQLTVLRGDGLWLAQGLLLISFMSFGKDSVRLAACQLG
jgi:hypothetical protein